MHKIADQKGNCSPYKNTPWHFSPLIIWSNFPSSLSLPILLAKITGRAKWKSVFGWHHLLICHCCHRSHRFHSMSSGLLLVRYIFYLLCTIESTPKSLNGCFMFPKRELYHIDLFWIGDTHARLLILMF